MTTLAQELDKLDGAGYGAYKSLRGSHDLGRGLTLDIDRVQSDPFAPPSLVRVTVPRSALPVDAGLLDASPVAAADHLTRRVASAIRGLGVRGGKEQGSLGIDVPGQQVLERSSVRIDDREVSVRLDAALPARGRRIRGQAARRLLCDVLPQVIDDALFRVDAAALREAVVLHLDQADLRGKLVEHDLLAFVSDGAVLARASGDSDLPLGSAVMFSSPDSLRRTFTLRSGREVTGMALPRGVTLIVGGGYHGKSTLLKALERGVYDHIGGDGREFAVAVGDAMALRAEDGRSVTDVDISQFIGDLPSGTDTTRFTTPNASGSTSQAAGLVEALEAGATTLLIDEDTSATNFMIRDERMRALVPHEPITPLLDRVRALWESLGVSTVLVAGGSGAFLDVADRVILLDSYRPLDVTDRARELAGAREAQAPFPTADARVPERGSPTPESRGARGGHGSHGGRGGPRGPKPPRAKGLSSIQLGEEFIDLSAVSQLVDDSQTRAIAAVLARLGELSDGRRSLGELVDDVLARVDADGIDTVSGQRRNFHPGRLARPRKQEIMAAVNRYRRLRCSH
ncbi:ABC-ATPase domain-containing protein [Corynebacterium halotolerans]|uniref:Putative ATPase of the ABC class n=1 Tax=Corynebacterium halotolerans YIM 70093 = DSM 44683 TaxID=1121362 RepID=M1NQC1_9CORY|nr:ABC-ATPase domain-containing protein [Corynebacterium halotolerans]AGF73568.1 putative ATPase of the ABC class [Corynebacterium halotolerans YIM 70093 = DSM 44683]